MVLFAIGTDSGYYLQTPKTSKPDVVARQKNLDDSTQTRNLETRTRTSLPTLPHFRLRPMHCQTREAFTTMKAALTVRVK